MLHVKTYTTLMVIFVCQTLFGQTTTQVTSFDKVIVSPHVQVTFIEGNEESVAIENSTVPIEKIKIEVNDKTLRIYLDSAKEVDKNRTVYEDGDKVKESVYKGTVVTAIVTYKTLNNLSLRGEETIVCRSILKGDKFKLKIYGEEKVFLNEVDLGELQTTVYGESYLEIKSGVIKDQRYICYGEGRINSLGIDNNTTKITAYGEANFQINASDAIKITAYGAAKLQYKGNAEISKGLNIGEVHIDKID